MDNTKILFQTWDAILRIDEVMQTITEVVASQSEAILDLKNNVETMKKLIKKNEAEGATV